MFEVLAFLDLTLASLLLMLAVATRGRLDIPASWKLLVAGAALTVLPVAGYWLTGRTHPNALGGLIAASDAAGYFNCAHRIISGAQVSGACAMRPYYMATLAGLLGLAQGTAQWALLIQAGIVGAVGGFAAREVWRSHGAIAGLAVFAALFVFASQFTMTMLTENAGLVLGMLAFTLLWRQVESVSPISFFAVMAILTIGLNARAGAFLVVPLLLLWSLLWTEGGPRLRIYRTLAGCAGIGLAIGVNAFLVGQLGGSAVGTHSNFAYVLYGVSVGGARYLQILIDHPELKDLSGDTFTREAYRLAFENILSQPHMLVVGYVRGLAHWLYELFRFVGWWPLRAVFVALWIAGLVASLWPVRKPPSWKILVRVLVLGVALSSPFLTWYGGNRVFAVTHPVDALLVGIGITALLRLFRHDIENRIVPLPRAGFAAAWSMFVILLPVIALPYMLASPLLEPVAETVECGPGETGMVADLGHDSPVLSIVGPGETSLRPLRVEAESSRNLVDRWTADGDRLRTLSANTSLIIAFDRRPEQLGKRQILIWRGEAPRLGISRICWRSSAEGWLPEATLIEPVS